MSSTQKTGATTTPNGYQFTGTSGLPEQAKYLGDVSVSAAVDYPFVMVADYGRQEYGRLPLSAVGTTYGGLMGTAATGTASGFVTPTSQAPVGSISFGLREDGGASALVVFVKSTGGITLSGFVSLGKVI